MYKSLNHRPIQQHLVEHGAWSETGYSKTALSIGRLTYYYATQCQPRAKTDVRVEDRLAQLMCNLPQVPVRVMVWNDFTTDEKYKLLGARLGRFFFV